MSVYIPTSINRLLLNKRFLVVLTVSISQLLTLNFSTYAQSRGVDVYSVNAPQRSGTKTNSTQLKSSNSAKDWFEKFDKLREQYHPTEKDRVILTRPLMQNPQRVQQWTNTASKIVKNYSSLSKSIRSLPVPAGMSDIKEYRDLMADWYQDSASVYNDMIRPRPPAKTVEDLQEEIDAVKRRAEGLTNNMASLKAMDREVREAHKLPPSMIDDTVQQFIHKK